MKKIITTYEDFVPDVSEDYSEIPYIVEDDKELQPAVALQQMLQNYGPAKVFAGYTSQQYSDDIPVTNYRPDLQTFTEQVRRQQEELARSALMTQAETDGAEQSESKPTNSASEQAVLETSSSVEK
jgi:hypothetical protein